MFSILEIVQDLVVQILNVNFKNAALMLKFYWPIIMIDNAGLTIQY